MPTTFLAVRLTCPVYSLSLPRVNRDVEEGENGTSFMDYLENLFDTIIVYQHDEAANVHCHLLLHSRTEQVTADRIKKSAEFKALQLGHRQHSFKTKYKDPDGNVHTITEDNCAKYITYMSKGKLNPEFIAPGGLYDYSDCKDLKEKWVEYAHESKTKKQVDAFTKHLDGKTWDSVRDYLVHPYNWLKGKVMHYIMAKYDGFDQRAKNEYCMLLITFSYKFAYDPPEKSKQWI